MNGKQLKALAAQIPDDADVVIPGPDHSYCLAGFRLTTALCCMGNFTEDHGEKLTPEKDYGKRVHVLLVS